MSGTVTARNLIALAETVVIKVGSRVLSANDGRLDVQQIASLARQVAQISDQGKQVVLVSSGAVASGVGKLGLEKRPDDLAELQAVAAVGQAHLIQAYERHFAQLGKHAAQVLLIADDLDDRARYLNVRNTLLACFRLNIIPIINENDTVAVEELQTTFGDNDRLAAMVAGVFAKPVLIILSDVQGVYDRHPATEGAKIIHQIETVDDAVHSLAATHRSNISKGGMASKIRAAQFVTQSGAPVVIAGGRIENVLPRLLTGEELGTLFLPRSTALVPKKRWLGFSTLPSGVVIIDEGAVNAIKNKGSSLLPIGITSVQGQFEKGDVISVASTAGTEVARGLSNYSSDDIGSIRGLRTSQIAEKLGTCPYAEVIHRDNMTLL